MLKRVCHPYRSKVELQSVCDLYTDLYIFSFINSFLHTFKYPCTYINLGCYGHLSNLSQIIMINCHYSTIKLIHRLININRICWMKSTNWAEFNTKMYSVNKVGVVGGGVTAQYCHLFSVCFFGEVSGVGALWPDKRLRPLTQSKHSWVKKSPQP